jgi:hypothetical protein
LRQAAAIVQELPVRRRSLNAQAVLPACALVLRMTAGR